MLLLLPWLLPLRVSTCCCCCYCVQYWKGGTSCACKHFNDPCRAVLLQVVDVFAMPQSGTGVSVEAVDPVFQTKMLDMLKQVGRCGTLLLLRPLPLLAVMQCSASHSP